MLTQNKKDTPYIGIFKLNTGEEVIAKVIDECSSSFTVKSPLCMVATQKGYQFAPLLMMADAEKGIVIPKPVITATPAPELEGQYESVTTGIALPQKSSIITS